MACCFIIWLLVVCCQTIMLPRCMKLLVALTFTTVVLCAALTLVMAEEFMHLPSALQRMSSVLVQNRFRRTMFICAVVGLICFSSTLSLVSIFAVNIFIRLTYLKVITQNCVVSLSLFNRNKNLKRVYITADNYLKFVI